LVEWAVRRKAVSTLLTGKSSGKSPPIFVAIGLSTAAQWPISTAILPYRAAWLCCKGRECKHSEQGSKSAEHRKIAVIAFVCNPASTARAARLDEFGMQSA